MANLIIALIGIAFAAVLAVAGVSYMSPNISIQATQSATLETEISQVVGDYLNLRTDLQRYPTMTDYQTVYNSHSANSQYNYTQTNGVVTGLSRPSAFPGASSGWVFSPSCGQSSGGDCFCLTVASGQSSSSANSIYQAALTAAKKQISSGTSSIIGLNTAGCAPPTVTSIGNWPSTPPTQYTLVVQMATQNTCSCNYQGSVYSCGISWQTSSPGSQSCSSGTGTETDVKTTTYTCTNGNVTSSVTYSPWDTSACQSSVAGVCANPGSSQYAPSNPATMCSEGTPSSVTASGGNWTWVCDGLNGGANSGTCSAPIIVYGQCNPLSGGSSATTPTGTLCPQGTPNPTTLGSPQQVGSNYYWQWTCQGANGGSTASCEVEAVCPVTSVPNGTVAPYPICTITCNGGYFWNGTSCVANSDAQCGSAKDTCASGTLDPASEGDSGGKSTWVCDGTGGSGTNTQCFVCDSGYFQSGNSSCTAVVTGVCGTPAASATAPSNASAMCTSGTPIPSTANLVGATWQWVCDGNNGPSSNSGTCSSPANVTGACGSDANGQSFAQPPWADGVAADYQNLCAPGDSSGDPVAPSASNGWTWGWACSVNGQGLVYCTAPATGGTCGSDAGQTFTPGIAQYGYQNLSSIPPWSQEPPNTPAIYYTGLCVGGTSTNTLAINGQSNGEEPIYMTSGPQAGNWVYSWQCQNGSSNNNTPGPTCYAYGQITGQCGSDIAQYGSTNNPTYTSPPWNDGNQSDYANLCKAGTTYANNGAGPITNPSGVVNGVTGWKGTFWSWSCNGVGGGPASPTCYALAPVTGTCGTASLSAWRTAPWNDSSGGTLCGVSGGDTAGNEVGPITLTSGTYKGETGYSWTCTPQNGTPVTCSAPTSGGGCGPDFYQSFSQPPWNDGSQADYNNLCLSGGSYVANSGISSSGTYNWSCTTSIGGAPAPASQNQSCVAFSLCGSDTAQTYPYNPADTGQGPWTVDSSHLCSAFGGSASNGLVPSAATGGKWQWTCNSTINGAQPATCTAAATISCNPGYFLSGYTCLPIVNGACGSLPVSSATSPTATCATGTPSAVTQGSTTWQWTCNGNDGSSSTNATCTVPIACNIATVANATVAPYPSCAITCNGGYVLNGSTCIAISDATCGSTLDTCSSGTLNTASESDSNHQSLWVCDGNDGSGTNTQCSTCDSGYTWNGSSCVASVPAGTCGSTVNTCSPGVTATSSGTITTAWGATVYTWICSDTPGTCCVTAGTCINEIIGSACRPDAQGQPVCDTYTTYCGANNVIQQVESAYGAVNGGVTTCSGTPYCGTAQYTCGNGATPDTSSETDNGTESTWMCLGGGYSDANCFSCDSGYGWNGTACVPQQTQ